jgi:tetratricopeptide (TPR) repeat protein
VPLREFFDELGRNLRAFVATPGPPRLRVWLTDPDTKPIVHRVLAGLENDDRLAAVFVPTDAPFETPAAFFRRVYDDLLEAYQPFAAELEARYVLSPLAWAKLRGAADERFTRGVAMFANALPVEVGAVTFVLDPGAVSDPDGYREALRLLAVHTPSDRVKYLVLDDRQSGPAAALAEELPGVKAEPTVLAPGEMEERVRRALESGIGVGPVERRAYPGLLAGFALARKEYDAALAHQNEQLARAAAGGSPSDLAAAHYNLGNVHLGRGDYPAAVETYTEALRLALGGPGLSGFVPTILTNLGVALFRGGAATEAAGCFDAALEYARKLNQPPTAAHVLDCMAGCHLAAGRADKAEQCWRDALETYDRITAGPLAFARDGGRRDILGKLEHLFQTTRQPAKLAALREEAAGAHSG